MKTLVFKKVFFLNFFLPLVGWAKKFVHYVWLQVKTLVFLKVFFFFFGALVGWALLFLSCCCCCWAHAPTTPCSHHGEIGAGYVSSQIEQLLTSYCRQHHHHPRVQGYWGLPTEYHTSKPPVVVVVVVAQTLNPQACT